MNIETPISTYTPMAAWDHSPSEVKLERFWEMPHQKRLTLLQEAIIDAHTWHYARNPAYRGTVSGRGVGPQITPAELPLALRPTAQTFKSYIDLLGTPFPQEKPRQFVAWLSDQLSVRLPAERIDQFRSRYRSLETLLREVESVYADYGLEAITSSGTSGRATIMVRDQDAIDRTVDSFYLSFQRYLKMQADHRAVFIMPQSTRIAMASMASFSVRRVGMDEDRIHYTIPYAALPDQVRIRTGRTFRSGITGMIERRVMNPFMNWAFATRVEPKTVQGTINLLSLAESAGEKVLLFGGWVQLHGIALALQGQNRLITLAPGSLVGSGGGMKEMYPYTPGQIRDDLMATIRLADGAPVTVRDVYGMAEANWAAMQCVEGNYHVPPWIYAVTLDEDGGFQNAVEASGLLAFFDPYGGGRLFPSFFKTADRVRLLNGGIGYKGVKTCACGDSGAYILSESIQRVDLLDEAGCAAQV